MTTISRLLKMIGLFCKRALQKTLYSAKETYNFKEPTHCTHPIARKWWQTQWVLYSSSFSFIPITKTQTWSWYQLPWKMIMIALIITLGGKCSNCIWNSLVFSYLASHSERRCLRCSSFCRWWKTENIYVNLASLVWGPTLLSKHTPPTHLKPSAFLFLFFLSTPPPFSPFPLLFSHLFFLFVLFSCESRVLIEKLIVGIPRTRGLLYSPWQPMRIPFAITPLGQLYQPPPSPIPGEEVPVTSLTCSDVETRMDRPKSTVRVMREVA